MSNRGPIFLSVAEFSPQLLLHVAHPMHPDYEAPSSFGILDAGSRSAAVIGRRDPVRARPPNCLIKAETGVIRAAGITCVRAGGVSFLNRKYNLLWKLGPVLEATEKNRTQVPIPVGGWSTISYVTYSRIR